MAKSGFWKRVRKEAGQETCNCDAYPFPHRLGGGKCNQGEDDTEIVLECEREKKGDGKEAQA